MFRHAFTGNGAALLLLASLWAGAAPAATAPELQAAREELRLRVETERRMRGDFERLLAGGGMTAAEIADFEDYLVSLGMLVDQQRRALAKLEGADAEQANERLPADFNRGQTDAEKIASLDAELGTSLSAFDEKLLREQKEISEKSRAASTSAAGGSSASRDAASKEGGEGEGQGEGPEGQTADGSGKSGGESAAGGSEAGGSSGRDSGKQGEPGEPGETGEAAGKGQEGGEQVASAGGPGDAGSQAGSTNVPADIPDGRDDDVVARQLREAAENEQDPELREKLWDEYRRYKSSTQ
jgi:hypothetical protein